MNKSGITHKLPFYYLAGVEVFLLLFTIYKQAPAFKTALNKDTSLAATPNTATFSSNQEFNQFGAETSSGNTLWFGSDSSSYLGLQFNDVSYPKDSTLNNVYLEFTPNADQWISQNTLIFGEKSDSPSIFSTNSLPSTRSKTTASVSFSDNTKWVKDQTYRLPAVTSVINELVVGGVPKKVSLLLQGNGTKYGRKFIYGGSSEKKPRLVIEYITYVAQTTPVPTVAVTVAPTVKPTVQPSSTAKPSTTPVSTAMPMPSGDSMAMMAWRVGGKNAPNPKYDKCDDGTDVVAAHNQYYVVAYDGLKYPTWHPAVVTNPVTGIGKCYFGHEHGTDPQKYVYWNEIVQHFGKDSNNDGVITAMKISPTGAITPGDRAGIPFGMANEHMDAYYNQEGRDSIFVRHEDHVGHKIEVVNNEAEMQGNSTHVMTQVGTTGISVPYYKQGTNTYQPTGVVCAHLHKFHQGTHSGDAMRNNLHEVIFHSSCDSFNVGNINAPALYPKNEVILTGMMTFGNPGTYQRFCLDNPPRTSAEAKVCVDGKNADGTCVINDPLISKLPDAVHSDTLGRNMIDRYCLENFDRLNPGKNYFSPYELWQGDLQITNTAGRVLAEHGRQWDVLDPIRFVDPASSTGFGYNADQCFKGGLLWSPAANNYRTLNCGTSGVKVAWDSPQSGFKGLHRTTYFGRNHIDNSGGAQIYWTDPLGGKAVTTKFPSGLKQKISTVTADIQRVQSKVQQLYGKDNFLNDRAIQRRFDDGTGTVHAPN